MLAVSACVDPYFYGYHLTGLQRETGARVRFVPCPLGPAHHRVLAVEWRGTRLRVDANDGWEPDPALEAWADLVVATNLVGEVDRQTIVSGPTFGVRRWGRVRWPLVLAAALRHGPHPPARYLAGFYRAQAELVGIDELRPAPGEPDRLFALSSLWAREPAVNELRARWCRVAGDREGTTFEGGFAPRRDGSTTGYEDLTYSRRLTHAAYLERVRRSAVVFNTPAVLGALGFKLGEFLALGKAIVSVPIERALPAPLVHGRHLHLVDGSRTSMEDALDRLLGDEPYRRSLEVGARAWWERWSAPDALVRRVLDAVG